MLSESEDLSQRTDNDESLGGEACGNWYGKPNTSLMLCHWKGEVMSVLKVIEIMGDSEKGWEAAAGEAVAEAAKTVKNIDRSGSKITQQPSRVGRLKGTG